MKVHGKFADMRRIADLLRVAPGKKIKSPLDMAEEIKRGLPRHAAISVKKALEMNNRQVAESLGISERTVGRWQKAPNSLLNLTESDRTYRLAKIYVLAVKVLEDKKMAVNWLWSPQFGLGGKVPLELMKTEAGAGEVESLLGRIEYGVLS